MGAVAYDAKVVIIWEGFRDWFRSQSLAFDYVLYSNYERQVEALMTGDIDVAWNSPLAWIRSERMAAAQGRTVAAVAMRDTDCDLTSVVVVGSGSAIDSVAGLAGRTLGVGALDSPQATLIPLGHLASLGLVAGRDFRVRRHDVAVGKHGDHVGGERDAAQALMSGEVDAACMTDGNHLLFATEGTLPPGSTRVLVQTPAYDHCNFTALSPSAMAGGTPPTDELLGRFKSLLLAMSYDDPSVRPLLDLEGLKEWREGRRTGYHPLEEAVTKLGFYDDEGQVSAADYRP